MPAYSVAVPAPERRVMVTVSVVLRELGWGIPCHVTCTTRFARPGVGVTVGVFVGHGAPLRMCRPHPLRVPVSMAALSLTTNCQVPLPFSPTNADSGLVGRTGPTYGSAQFEPTGLAALS